MLNIPNFLQFLPDREYKCFRSCWVKQEENNTELPAFPSAFNDPHWKLLVLTSSREHPSRPAISCTVWQLWQPCGIKGCWGKTNIWNFFPNLSPVWVTVFFPPHLPSNRRRSSPLSASCPHCTVQQCHLWWAERHFTLTTCPFQIDFPVCLQILVCFIWVKKICLNFFLAPKMSNQKITWAPLMSKSLTFVWRIFIYLNIYLNYFRSYRDLGDIWVLEVTIRKIWGAKDDSINAFTFDLLLIIRLKVSKKLNISKPIQRQVKILQVYIF